LVLINNRVFDIASKLGRNVRKVKPKEDYSQKTDLIIDGIPIQVSCQPKSNKQRRALLNKGIFPVVAGENVSDEIVKEQLSEIK